MTRTAQDEEIKFKGGIIYNPLTTSTIGEHNKIILCANPPTIYSSKEL